MIAEKTSARSCVSSAKTKKIRERKKFRRCFFSFAYFQKNKKEVRRKTALSGSARPEM